MAKTFKHLYADIYDFQNLFKAYLKARRNKRYHNDVLLFSANLEENLIQLQNDLIYKTYTPGRYREFYVHDPKTRLVMAAPFRDRVLHHAICNIIEPIFDRTFIDHSFACRRGKGTLAGVRHTVGFLRQAIREHGKIYCLKADIAKYFPSINHNVLRNIIRKKIQCKDTLHLLDTIIDSTVENGEINSSGIPIGNLTSQLFANIYLNQLDHYVKHQHRIKFYIRYMDDFLILHHDKRHLYGLWREVEDFLLNQLVLTMNKKTSLFPIGRGIDFLGYRIWPNRKILRKANVKRIKRIIKKMTNDYRAGNAKLPKIRAVLASWLGHSKQADVPKLRGKIIEKAELIFGLKGIVKQ